MAGYETGCLAWSLAGHDKEGSTVTDEEIKYFIKQYRANHLETPDENR